LGHNNISGIIVDEKKIVLNETDFKKIFTLFSGYFAEILQKKPWNHEVKKSFSEWFSH
jgi:hypothetical protein